MLLEAKNLS